MDKNDDELTIRTLCWNGVVDCFQGVFPCFAHEESEAEIDEEAMDADTLNRALRKAQGQFLNNSAAHQRTFLRNRSGFDVWEGLSIGTFGLLTAVGATVYQLSYGEIDRTTTALQFGGAYALYTGTRKAIRGALLKDYTRMQQNNSLWRLALIRIAAQMQLDAERTKERDAQLVELIGQFAQSQSPAEARASLSTTLEHVAQSQVELTGSLQELAQHLDESKQNNDALMARLIGHVVNDTQDD